MRAADGDSPSGAELAGLAVMLAVLIVVPLLAGLALDSALGRGPIFLLGGICVGVAAAGAAVYVRFKRYL